jgi:Rhodopirellula transposase DDE domain
MGDPAILEAVQTKYQRLYPLMNARMRRQWAACEALALEHGGVATVARATGLARTTSWAGLRALQHPAGLAVENLPAERSRAPGGGRHTLVANEPTLIKALEALVEPTTRGDPMSPLRWTCKSTRQLAAELQRQGHAGSYRTVAALLHALDSSLQAPRKTREGAWHPARNAQFEHINRHVRAFPRRGQPVISVDTKKKELGGDFKNGGRAWHPQGSPERLRTHDFVDKELGKVIPSGVYAPPYNEGWVSVGLDHHTASFATATSRRWWQEMGRQVYPQAKALLVAADAGGSTSSRSRSWKVAGQVLADSLRLRSSVCHCPPGTSKWNKIEHRRFCHITNNWRGRPLISRTVIVNLIGNTKTKTGLRIKAARATNLYETGLKVSDEQLAAIHLKRDKFHGDWN